MTIAVDLGRKATKTNKTLPIGTPSKRSKNIYEYVPLILTNQSLFFQLIMVLGLCDSSIQLPIQVDSRIRPLIACRTRNSTSKTFYRHSLSDEYNHYPQCLFVFATKQETYFIVTDTKTKQNLTLIYVTTLKTSLKQ